ncbi:MAG: STAS domain-containing protein [Verrucomicrobiae bacterium]|nr:STAS domain-containing protein [Verrucomicrobiae bacterium]
MITHTFQSEAKTLCVTVPDNVVSTNVDQLRQELFGLFDLEELKETGWKVLSLDLSAARMVDSVGLNLIVTLVKEVQKRGGKMTVTIASGNVHRAFLFTRLDRQVELTVV